MKKLLLALTLVPILSLKAQEKAVELAHKFIITDGHVDLPYRLKVQNFQLTKEYTGIPVESENGDFDFKRAKEGGLDAPFMSIYIPASYTQEGGEKLADSLINMVEYIAKEDKDYFQIATSPKEVRKAFKKGKIALPMGMENGSPVGSVEDIAYFKKRGISYITLTHSKVNQLGDSSYDTTRVWQGLSPFGEEVVQEMARQGIMIDISHVSDSTFYDVMKITPIPVIASHSSLRHFTPDFERNMTDEMVKMVKENNGVIMINFGSTFLDGKVTETRNTLRKEMMEMLEEKGLGMRDPGARELIRAFGESHPEMYSDVEMVVNHIERVVNLAGVDHVGFGSDFDGVGDSLPLGLKDVSDYPNIINLLLEKGYSDEDIEKICSGNLFRVWQATLDYAKKH
ncbi:dipeptidase [Jiulongibacter sediminis]|uniref:Peptidase M19 n=1 Tax=Jiulongibacter sediminis TaxID=1605367 RepID=A0A0P7C4K7_9BACT|nr:dipeptidase [Jiulongibacter sediminis]KPM46840.1 peptidase M19 [Jiulongibacter sediminis]TBX22190.1 peptidase M19 [Jiulongibacter sediminis]